MSEQKKPLVDDTFQSRCRARKKDGKRCTKRAQWLIPLCISRQSWLDALKTGWPRCVRGMKSPEERMAGFCRRHGCVDHTDGKPRFVYGWGMIAKVKLGSDYEEAKRTGDEAVKTNWNHR